MITKKKKKMKKEIEVKIELTKEEFYKLTKGFKDFDLERTFGYFKEDFSNIKDGIFPRIKYIDGMNREVILTVKVKTNDNSQFFEREEFEVRLKEGENVETLREILKFLSFDREIIFEKKRKNIIKKDITISFDELPFGFFIEFEAEPEIINQYLDEFNLSNRSRITKAYLGLWEDYKRTHNILEENCLFK
ncbi:MAG: hypothetical protein A3D35_01680 [Candidatus Staskawiczbacteria bacterium RIFCSPHIGHO2_02_FULL_34_9]|uniref:CYTH domain-containing protein n=1 Tax=Candidatus Staskawiczbacteria bacterium RIFCSPHIGHO2_02_FULL_34_9 TaxID=1802206 RepID=A0A1G2HY64_9BACT|nr:MAG: hypothetical protein A3D35_01680 [Candidatus Staskawiczbacteria bacterium RIFCSPHIGHO2_02_FULL_34_9]